MSCYHHLTIEERELLYGFLQKGLSRRKIASEMGRSPSTISRELKRNGDCLPAQAQRNYTLRRKNSVRKRLLSNPALEADVRFFLGHLFWSPEQIANRFRLEGKHTISTSTIYRALDNGLLRDTLRYYLRFKYKKLGKAKKKSRQCFHRSIDDRPPDAADRLAFGHWEGDTIVSHKSTTVIATLVDRRSRFLTAGRVSSKEAGEVRKVVVRLLKETKRPVKSITFDQGTEFSEGRQMEDDLETRVYFAHPHSPWERPSNENTNGLLRQFIPKHRNLNELMDEEILHFVALLNMRPRKCLDWSTPYEIFSECVLHFT